MSQKFFNFSKISLNEDILDIKPYDQSFRYRGRICITNINNRDFNVHQGISLK